MHTEVSTLAVINDEGFCGLLALGKINAMPRDIANRTWLIFTTKILRNNSYCQTKFQIRLIELFYLYIYSSAYTSRCARISSHEKNHNNNDNNNKNCYKTHIQRQWRVLRRLAVMPTTMA